MKITAFRFLLCALLSAVFSLQASAQTQPGQIKAARVENEVRKLLTDGTTAPVKNGDVLTEQDVITTGKGASVVLVFMNGSSVKLGGDSRLAIDEFKMDPLAEDLHTGGLQAEPSVSKTQLNLAYGEMVGDVKKLNTSSTYSIKTPVGAAGIRGTIFRIVFRPDGNGKALFTISTSEGKVVMEGVTDAEIPVDAGKEVVVTIDLPDTAGKVVLPPVIITRDLTPATVNFIRQATESIVRDIEQLFRKDEPPAKAGETQESRAATPPPDPETIVPSLTPGAGQ
jgi:FecR-like protein